MSGYGWSPSGPDQPEVQLTGWWAVVQNTGIDEGRGFDNASAKVQERVADQGRGQDVAAARLVSVLQTSEGALGYDQLDLRGKFTVSEGATGADSARVGPRVSESALGYDRVSSKARVVGLDAALAYDLAGVPKVRTSPFEQALGTDVATSRFTLQTPTTQTWTTAGTYTYTIPV